LRRYDPFEQRISGIFLSQINKLISNFFSNRGSVTRLMIPNKIPIRTTYEGDFGKEERTKQSGVVAKGK